MSHRLEMRRVCPPFFPSRARRTIAVLPCVELPYPRIHQIILLPLPSSFAFFAGQLFFPPCLRFLRRRSWKIDAYCVEIDYSSFLLSPYLPLGVLYSLFFSFSSCSFSFFFLFFSFSFKAYCVEIDYSLFPLSPYLPLGVLYSLFFSLSSSSFSFLFLFSLSLSRFSLLFKLLLLLSFLFSSPLLFLSLAF